MNPRAFSQVHFLFLIIPIWSATGSTVWRLQLNSPSSCPHQELSHPSFCFLFLFYSPSLNWKINVIISHLKICISFATYKTKRTLSKSVLGDFQCENRARIITPFLMAMGDEGQELYGVTKSLHGGHCSLCTSGSGHPRDVIPTGFRGQTETQKHFKYHLHTDDSLVSLELCPTQPFMRDLLDMLTNILIVTPLFTSPPFLP